MSLAHELHAIGEDFGGPLVAAFLVGELPCTEFTLDGDLGTLGEKLAADFCLLAKDGDAMPLMITTFMIAPYAIRL